MPHLWKIIIEIILKIKMRERERERERERFLTVRYNMNARRKTMKQFDYH